RGRQAVARRRSPRTRPSSAPSMGGQYSGAAVELLDHAVPDTKQLSQPAPVTLVTAGVEVGLADALLLDPGVVAEVEDAVAVDVVQLPDMGLGHAAEVLAEDTRRAHVVELGPADARHVGRPLAGVELGTVGRNRQHHVVG